MKKACCCVFYLALLFSVKTFAQNDAWSGTWAMDYQSESITTPVYIHLQIAVPERNVLFPAHLTLTCGGYTAGFDLLLVKKNTRELAISKNKYPRFETPFSIGDETFYLNGIFDQSKDPKGIPQLSLRRVHTKPPDMLFGDSARMGKKDLAIARVLSNLLRTAELMLKKINATPWPKEAGDNSIYPPDTNIYFGLLDTIIIPERDGILTLGGTKKPKNDMVSFAMNGQVMNEQIRIHKKNYTTEVLLDTGLNILAFFADNFGNALPNLGQVKLLFGGKKIELDFSNKADSGATFIVAKLYYGGDKSRDKYFQPFIPAETEPIGKNDKLMGSLLSTSQTLTLAIMDDAVEDGDSISINLNDKWIVRGFPVKKYPQFITIALQPGTNTLIFNADNLGTIPPNTSVVEIIDGIKRQAYSLETSMGENNLIKVYYEAKPK